MSKAQARVKALEDALRAVQHSTQLDTATDKLYALLEEARREVRWQKTAATSAGRGCGS